MRTQTASWQLVRCAVALLFVFVASPWLCANAAPTAPSHATVEGPPDGGGRGRPRAEGPIAPSDTANDAWTGEFPRGDKLLDELEKVMKGTGLLPPPGATGEKPLPEEATLVKNQARPGLPEPPASDSER
jgi:hypothetical protein